MKRHTLVVVAVMLSTCGYEPPEPLVGTFAKTSHIRISGSCEGTVEPVTDGQATMFPHTPRFRLAEQQGGFDASRLVPCGAAGPCGPESEQERIFEARPDRWHMRIFAYLSGLDRCIVQQGNVVRAGDGYRLEIRQHEDSGACPDSSSAVTGTCTALEVIEFAALPEPDLEVSYADGSTCTRDDDCASQSCTAGLCGGSTCGNDSGCASGWGCRHTSDFFGFNSSSTCTPRCGSCPASYACEDSGEWCHFIASPDLEVELPYEAAIGDEVTLRANVSSPVGAEIDRVTWYFDDLSEIEGTEIQRVLSAADADVGHSFSVTVVAVDAAGGYDQQDLGFSVAGR